MISCPAAKQIRWVNPSMATVSPSRTRSATASCIDTTLPASGIAAFGHALILADLRFGRIVRPLQHTELVALGIAHHDPGGLGPAEPLHDRRAQSPEAFDLFVPRPGRGQVQVDPALDRFRLGHPTE